MTPTEWSFWLNVLQRATQHAYSRGHDDGKAGKPAAPEQFTLTAGHKLTLAAELAKTSRKKP